MKLINFHIIFRTLSFGIIIEGLSMLACNIIAFFYDEKMLPLTYSAIICLTIGGLMYFFTRKHKLEIVGQREAFITVFLTWFLMGILGSLPFLFSASIKSFTDACFESISGFTTTGASILQDVESLPKSILFWRSTTHFIGGMGILVLTIAIMSNLSDGSIKIYSAEVSGASKEKIRPTIRETARTLWFIYIFLNALAAITFYLLGMNLFESITHAFGAVATGGFSPKNSSISEYSNSIKIATCLFMFLGSINFNIYYLLYKKQLKKISINDEFYVYVIFVITISLIASMILFFTHQFNTLGECLVQGFFNCISIVTTCGYSSCDYNLWHHSVWVILFLLFFTNGMIGSTSGGIKFSRNYLLLKNLRYEVRRMIHPQIATSIKISRSVVKNETIRNCFIVFSAYLIIFFIGSILMSIFVDEPQEAFGTTISCLVGCGPAFGDFGPYGNYSSIHDMGKWILSFIMILGRLEIIPLLALFYKVFWKK